MFGYHVAKEDGFATAIPRAVANIRACGIPRPCIQIYAAGPRTAHPIIKPADYGAIRAASRDIALVIHGAYIDNPWQEYKKTTTGSTTNIIRELEISHHIGSRGVVVHLAAGALEQESIDHVLQTIDAGTPDEVLATQVLFLEINTAKASAATYETPEKIAALFRRVEETTQGLMMRLRVGLCIDSAHVFSCGVSFADYTVTRDWLARVRGGIPANTPIMFHLNDSGSTLGSGKDVHEDLCHGAIWSEYKTMLPVGRSGIAAIIEFITDTDCMCIREHKTHFPAEDLRLIASLL